MNSTAELICTPTQCTSASLTVMATGRRTETLAPKHLRRFSVHFNPLEKTTSSLSCESAFNWHWLADVSKGQPPVSARTRAVSQSDPRWQNEDRSHRPWKTRQAAAMWPAIAGLTSDDEGYSKAYFYPSELRDTRGLLQRRCTLFHRRLHTVTRPAHQMRLIKWETHVSPNSNLPTTEDSRDSYGDAIAIQPTRIRGTARSLQSQDQPLPTTQPLDSPHLKGSRPLSDGAVTSKVFSTSVCHKEPFGSYDTAGPPS